MGRKIINVFLVIGLIGIIIGGIWLLSINALLPEAKFRLASHQNAVNSFGSYENPEFQNTVDSYTSQRNVSIIVLCISGILFSSSMYLKFSKSSSAPTSSKVDVTNLKPTINSTNSSALKELRELLDSDLISKEEYEKKRKEILNRL